MTTGADNHRLIPSNHNPNDVYPGVKETFRSTLDIGLTEFRYMNSHRLDLNRSLQYLLAQ